MSVSEIKMLPLHEKLQIMEALWVDLKEHFENTEISPQTMALLDDRRRRGEQGESPLLDWDAVKGSIGRA